jgi:hypothetical protein
MRVNKRELSDDEMDRRLGRQYRKIDALHSEGACDHPASIPSSQWAGILRGSRTAADDEADISPVPTGADGPVDAHSRNRAHDAAPTQSMADAFPGFDRVGHKFPVPPRK